MRISRLIPPLTAATVAVLMLGQAAHADLLINIDKSAQRMTVTVNGEQLYEWPVSTGGRGYDTPSGTFKPFRMEIDHTTETMNLHLAEIAETVAPGSHAVLLIRLAALDSRRQQSWDAHIRDQRGQP